MKIRRVDFKISAAGKNQFPREGLPEIAFVGRSNVGKSSLLNTLVGRRNLARVSQTPGKTRLINFFLVNDRFYLVDLPGYGFARVSKDVKLQWGKLIETYLRERRELIGVVQLIDLRHPPFVADGQMLNALGEFRLPLIIVATKADKISRGRRQEQVKQIRSLLHLPADFPVICHSVKTGEGREELLALIQQLLESRS